jgi:integral membrane protein (TIGR01906 family)
VGTRLGGWLIAAAAALVILGASVAPFLTPPVVRFEQDRTGAAALTGYSPVQLDIVTGALLGDLVFGLGDFDVEEFESDGSIYPRILDDSERAHMRDVRTVFTGFWLLVLGSIAVLAVAFRRGKDHRMRSAAWRAVSNGARALAIVIAILGAFALVAFDTAFELFHRLFFSAGSYTFDPATSRLVQLFPDQFWSEITIAVGVVAITVALLTAWFAGRRAARGAAARETPILTATRAGA